eukprot:6318975-Amphidinium_carterae.1
MLHIAAEGQVLHNWNEQLLWKPADLSEDLLQSRVRDWKEPSPQKGALACRMIRLAVQLQGISDAGERLTHMLDTATQTSATCMHDAEQASGRTESQGH